MADESIEELLASGAVVPDRPGSKRLVPAAQSVVVPVGVLNEAAGVLDCEGYGPLSMSLPSCLSAPAPSSLAGGALDPQSVTLEWVKVETMALEEWRAEFGDYVALVTLGHDNVWAHRVNNSGRLHYKTADEAKAAALADLQGRLSIRLHAARKTVALYDAALSPEAPAREGVEPWKEGREEGRLAARPWRKGDPVPAVGTMVLVSGAHGDIESDQHRAFQWRRVIGYGVDGADFICLQNKGCWPTVERMENCWFAALTRRHEAPACTTCGGKGYTEHEGGDGEGYPSRPEIDDCPRCHEAPAEPWYGDRDPQEVDQAYGSYDGTSCAQCGRERVMVGGATGRRICEKCGLYQEAPAEGAGDGMDAYTRHDAIIALRARSSAPEAREGEAVRRQRCTRCDRGEVFGMSDDSGFWVEFSSVAGGANEHGMNGWLELVEHWPDGRDVRREYVAKDSTLYAAPSADKLRTAVEVLINAKRMLADKAIMPVQRVSWASKDVEKALAALEAEVA